MPEQKNSSNNMESNEYSKINKHYEIIYSIIFRYGILFIIFALAIVLFSYEIKKSVTLHFSNNHEEEEKQYLLDFSKDQKEIKDNEELEINVLVQNGFLDATETLLHSYNNLLSFQGLTMPRGTYLQNNYNVDNIVKDAKYFSDSGYSLDELSQFLRKVIYVNYNNIQGKNMDEVKLIPLDNNSIEDTFFISCANNPKLFNHVCDSYIRNFLNNFYVYDLSEDYEGTVNILKTLVGKKDYKEKTCQSLINYVKFSNTAPYELEDIATICGGEYLDYYYLVQNFIQVQLELENRYLRSNVSKYKEINDYKLLSYQQILYNNMENNIPPYEGTFKDYTDYIATILQKIKQNPISNFYLDTTFWFNNFYLIPELNKLKYQSTQAKREEIESILTYIEKINNGSSIDGYQGLRNLITNKKILEKEIESLGITTQTSGSSNNTTKNLLKNIRSLNYLKIINDETNDNLIKINGYLLITIKGTSNSIFFGTTLENKRGSLIVKEFSLNDYQDLNETINIIIKQKDYTLQEIYEFIQENISIYLSEELNLTPCDILKNKLDTLNIGSYEMLFCDKSRINIVKGGSGEKTLYQIKMDNYDIESITTTDKEIQGYINNTFTGIRTNSITISNIVSNIVAYVPTVETNISQNLEGNNNAIIAIDDLRNFLGAIVTDIAEENGKVAAEFTINNINFIGIYDTDTKKLGPLFLRQGNDSANDLNFRNFALYLTSENQNEINKFIIETIQYLKGFDEDLINIYINGTPKSE